MKAFKSSLRLAAAFVVILCASYHVLSPVKLTITSPTDKTTTENTTLMINGEVASAKSVSINGASIRQAGGKFEAMANLRPGKNLIEITASGTGGDKTSRALKIIRIISFDDLKQLFGLKEHWAKNQVIALATLGIVEGYSNNEFRPEDPVTRGEFATWLARAKGLKTARPDKDLYFDVPKEHWRAPFIKAVRDAGIMGGLSENVFGIDTPLKRSDAVTIMAKAYNILTSGKTAKSPFDDVSASAPDSKYITSAYEKGLVVGTSRWKRSFDPNRDTKRAEAAVMLSRLQNVKTMSAALYDFSVGFNPSKYCRINTRPIIKKAFIKPETVVNDGKNDVKISAFVFDEQGKGDISQVWADLTEIGGPLNAKMNVMTGESYGISFSVSGEAKPGEKKIVIHAMDRSGLKADAALKLKVEGK